MVADGQPDAVSCSAADACTATGADLNAAGVVVPLVERWDGSQWRLQRAPSPPASISATLSGVACVARAACTAVGHYRTASQTQAAFAEEWDGASWTVEQVPQPPGSGGLLAVSCAAPGLCTAAGEYSDSTGAVRPWAVAGSGGAWTLLQLPSPAGALAAGLFSVSCTAPSRCVAGGAYEDANGVTNALAEKQEGTAWTLLPTPVLAGSQASGFAGISCAGGHSCVAVGSSTSTTGATAPLSEAWDGSDWHAKTSPLPAGASSGAYSAVTCVTAAECTAVGDDTASVAASGSASSTQPLAERWDGSRWLLTHTADPAGTSYAVLNAVSCTPGVCEAIGDSETAAARVVPLAEGTSADVWALQPAPAPQGAATNDNLLAVSCPAAQRCLAVGYRTASPLLQRPLAEAWNGSSWRLVPVMSPPGATSSQLQAISCARADECITVGSSVSPGGGDALVETWNGQRWTVVASPAPPPGVAYALYGVSCPAAHTCIAVGTATSSSGEVALSEAWDGTNWRVVSMPQPAGGGPIQLRAVSCVSASACTAVGFANQAVVASWDGLHWHLDAVPVPSGSAASGLLGVSCVPVATCLAVGWVAGAQGVVPLVERRSAAGWTSASMPLPAANPLETDANALSCATATSCTAVGYYLQSNELATPFAERWDGSQWTVEPVPVPAGSLTSTLQAVACDRDGCLGTGSATLVSLLQVSLAVTRGTP